MILLGIVASFLSVNALQKRGAADAAFARSKIMWEKGLANNNLYYCFDILPVRVMASKHKNRGDSFS